MNDVKHASDNLELRIFVIWPNQPWLSDDYKVVHIEPYGSMGLTVWAVTSRNKD